MATITVALSDGEPAFLLTWSEPMYAEFSTRLAAERFAAWLTAIGCSVEVDGSCGPCSANHAGGHDCPSCGADLGLRIAPPPGVALAGTPPRPVEPDPFLLVREQHRIRIEAIETAERAKAERLAEIDDALEASPV